MNSAIEQAVKACGSASELARRIAGRQQEIWNWSNVRPIPPDRCPAIERATSAQVTCEELRPDVVWVRVPDAAWPHPGGRPCIDVAAPAAELTEARHAA